MATPKLTYSEQDGKLGIIPPEFGRPLAIVGQAEKGSTDPQAFGRAADISAEYGSGRLPAAAIYAAEKYGVIPLCVRTGTTTAGSVGTLVSSLLGGTSVPTLQTGTVALDDHEVKILFANGGTIGTAGITYQVSLDDGRNYGAVTDLGTAVFLQLYSGGPRINFAAGTIVAGATLSWRCTAPQANSAELQTALDALKASAQDWEIVYVTGDIDATLFDTIDAAVAGMREKTWIGGVRVPNVGETRAAYLTAISGIVSSKASSRCGLCYGGIEVASQGRNSLRSLAFAYAALEASLTAEQNAADPTLGPMLGVSIKDKNGNAKHHDEDLFPGADALRLVTARTWADTQGVYINRPLLLSATGSDYDIMPKRRVMNVARRVVRPVLTQRLNRPLRVSRKTGYLLREDADEIESTVNAALSAGLLGKPLASSARAVINRTDNILATKQFQISVRVIPLAYPEEIKVDFAFENPVITAF